MTKFENAVKLVVDEMLEEEFGCIDIYFNGNDFAQLHVMEYADWNMHQVMRTLHKKLVQRLGFPPSICHNHPTDEIIHIIGDPISAAVYYSDECCKMSTIKCCLDFLKTRTGYRDEIQSMALAAECIAENTGRTPEYVLVMLSWDKDPQAQLIRQLVNFHN